MIIKVFKKGATSYYLQLISKGGWYKIGYSQYLMLKNKAQIVLCK